MFRFLAAPIACLVLTGAAAAQERTDGSRPVAASSVANAQLPDQEPRLLLDSLALRHPEPEAAQTTSALRIPADLPKEALRAAPRPWCAQDRRVGTGAGFCLIN
ncbi:hypothetical protein [Methylobacterium pseudosasicola]|uniref:Uncharacterized protein n=1 Tax=Methylobacterium pseudosasicola TaxID=582667 RepID=A0A1I4MIM9_9HYPH|nr:hypothetical protein [Methylobacterium pseudosasicola]SFM03282.1 hypothetical protein SAMN05192568_101716 [Methylobacterium pseudosasicola]